VIALLRTPARRITLAIGLSALVHATILWLPYIQLPHAKVELPPLSARLVPLPNPAEKPAAKAETANTLTKSAGPVSAKRTQIKLSKMEKATVSLSAKPFPGHLQLTFVVHEGKGGLMTGQIRHRLDIREGRYTLQSLRQAAGPARLRNKARIIQTSLGRIDEHGMRPDAFEEQDITASGKQNLQVTFDRDTQQLRFSSGVETALPDDAQDSLSFMYQLSQAPMNGEYFTLPVSNGTQLQQYQIEIGAKENIDTPMGKLRALHLRKMHLDGEAYFDIWLGLEYRLLPVKFSRVDGSGNVTDEFVISDIRSTADE